MSNYRNIHSAKRIKRTSRLTLPEAADGKIITQPNLTCRIFDRGVPAERHRSDADPGGRAGRLRRKSVRFAGGAVTVFHGEMRNEDSDIKKH